jgi:hypothetical protein
MHRGKSKRKEFKRAQWSQNQKLQAVSTYLMLGNMAQTAIVTGIPYQTLQFWKTSDWFKDYVLQLQAEDVQQMDSNIRRIVDKSLKAVEDRIDTGDNIFDQKTGKIRKIPVSSRVALKITTDLLTQKEKLSKNPIKEEMEKTIDGRLLRLSEEFAKFAQTKKLAVDTPLVERVVEEPRT